MRIELAGRTVAPPTLYVKIVATACSSPPSRRPPPGAIGSPPPAADKGLTQRRGARASRCPCWGRRWQPDDEVVGEDEADAADADAADEADDEATEADESDEADEPKDNHCATRGIRRMTTRSRVVTTERPSPTWPAPTLGKRNADDEDAEDTDGPGRGPAAARAMGSGQGNDNGHG